MKKIVLILMLGVFTLSLSSFKAENVNCKEYAMSEATVAYEFYQANDLEFNWWDSWDVYHEALGDCQDGYTGGSVWITN